MIRHPFLRFLAWVGCLLSLVAALVLGLATAWFWQTFAGQGLYSASLGVVPADPQARAIVLDVERVEAAVPNLPLQVRTLLTIKPAQTQSGADPADLFIGLAPASEVDAYLAGSPYAVDRIVDGTWSTVLVPGDGTPPAPQEAAWVASDRGPAPSVPIEGGSGVTVAMMNADGSAPVEVRLFLVMLVQDATTYQGWAVAITIGLVVLAWTLGYVAMVRLAPRPSPWQS